MTKAKLHSLFPFSAVICVFAFAHSIDLHAESKAYSYKVEKTDVIPGVKRSLDVRLSEKISKSELEVLAIKLKGSESSTYQRTFIGYYLPGMKIGSGAWATTHFNPDLKVEILGLSVEDQASGKPVVPTEGSILGTWLDESAGATRITLVQKEKKLFAELAFKDGSELTQELKKVGSKFVVKDSEYGEYFLIKADKSLLSGDSESSHVIPPTSK